MRGLFAAALAALALFGVMPAGAAPLQPATAGPCPQFFAGGVEPQLAASRPLLRKLCYPSYAVLHDGAWREPAWVAEHLTAAQVQAAAKVARAGAFHVEEAIPAAERSTNADYLKAGYDKGHQAPADDMPDKPDSFALSNMTPQRPSLNRAVWLGVETAVRGLAEKDGEVWVVTGPQIGANPTLLNGRVAVPLASWKAVDDPKLGAGAYLCADDDSETCKVISIAELKPLIGLDPFPSLPAAVKDRAATLPAPDPKFIHPVR